ncbi:MAG TPA: hypothetical protein VGL88_15840 [Pseudonocardiaceae bacterium]|jgi:hypothetical protein
MRSETGEVLEALLLAGRGFPRIPVRPLLSPFAAAALSATRWAEAGRRNHPSPSDVEQS